MTQAMINSKPEIFTFAHSPLGLPVTAYRWKQGPRKVLILGGVHGDEIEGVTCALGLLDEWSKKNSHQLDLTLIPQFNIDGVLTKQRMNSSGVDLNRNLPTKDWSPEIKTPRYHPGPRPNSEPENQALSKWIETEKPNFILSLHSWHPVLNVNGDCLAEAESLAASTGYKIDTDIGYPTPGCLGSYAGLERGCPTLTYEIQRGLPLNEVLRIHVHAIEKCLAVTAKK